MKVAMIGLRSPTASGGIETMVRQVAPHLARRGVDLTVFCRSRYNRAGPRRENGIELVNIPTLYTKHLETIVYTFLSVLSAWRRGCRVFHFQALGPGLLAFLARALGRRCIVTVQALDWQRRKWGWLARRVLRLGEWLAVRVPHRTVAVSRALQRDLEARHHRPVLYIPNATEPEPDRPLDRLRRFGLEPGRYVLFLSRIVPEKGLHLLIEAFRALDTDWKLVVAGDAHYDQDYGRDLMRRTEGCERIVFCGPLFGEEKQEALSNAGVFVLPSDLEGLSLALLEAMSHGVCPLVSDIEMNLEVIGPMEPAAAAGVAFRRGDAQSLRCELARLLADPDQRRRLGERARRKVLREYTWERVAEAYVKLYEEMAK